MLNDIRLEVKGLTPKAEQILAKADELLDRTDKQVPRILAETEQVTKQLDRHLPRILAQGEVAIDNLADVSENFKQYKGLMGIVHVATQNKGLFSYGTSLLSWLGGHDATVGTKPVGSDQPLRQTTSAKEWATAAVKDAHFLSLGAKSKEDVLHGLARTKSATPWHVQFGNQTPRLLADWFKETHVDSK